MTNWIVRIAIDVEKNMKARRFFLILAVAIALVSCASSPKSPPENVSPSPVFKSEEITFDGSEWYHVHFVDKKGKSEGFMKNKPVVINVKFGDGREGRIWRKATASPFRSC